VLWPQLADSWSLRAVRAFKARFPEAVQSAEADDRIAFLIERYRAAQAELNRLGYDAGPVDGIWGLQSVRAMRAFQSDSGLGPDGMVSEASLSRLQAAIPRIATEAIPISDPEWHPNDMEPAVTAASVSTGGAIPEGSRWTSSGESDGSKVFATATRRGDTVTVVFDVDHRDSGSVAGQFTYTDHYALSCTVSVADPLFKCRIPGSAQWITSAEVVGAFPRLRFTFRTPVNATRLASYRMPDDIVLEFRPEPTSETPRIAAQAAKSAAQQPDRSEPEVAALSAHTANLDGSRWTASGKSDGSRVTATAIRQGDALKVELAVEHPDDSTGNNGFGDRYTQSCTGSVGAPIYACWIRGRIGGGAYIARVFGAFPRLTFDVWDSGLTGRLLPTGEEIVLDFRPEPTGAVPAIVAPASATPDSEPQPARPEPEVALVLPPARDGITEGSPWSASGESGGPKIFATATRQGDALEVVFEVDHRLSHGLAQRFAHRSRQSCTVSVADRAFECWIAGRPNTTLGAKVFGTFPQLKYQVKGDEPTTNILPGDIVLSFRPEPQLAQN